MVSGNTVDKNVSAVIEDVAGENVPVIVVSVGNESVALNDFVVLMPCVPAIGDVPVGIVFVVMEARVEDVPVDVVFVPTGEVVEDIVGVVVSVVSRGVMVGLAVTVTIEVVTPVVVV